MARAAKLKVYCMPAGFYDALVAAPSQKAALKAWGVTTDLFAAGRATIVEDEALQAKALDRPGEIIKRMRGDEAAMLGPEPARAPGPEPVTKKTATKKAPALPSPPDRASLDAAERALADAEREIAGQLAALAAEREDLARREREARSAGEARLKGLRKGRDAAATAYARAVERSRTSPRSD